MSTAARARDALLRALRTSASDRLDIRPSSDARVDVGHHGTNYPLRPIWAAEGFPADVRLALHAAADVDTSATPVVVARRLSPGSRAALAEQGLSWADEAGGLDLSVGPILLRVPSPTPSEPPRQPRLTAAAGAVAERLLHRATTGESLVPPVAELAADVGASPGAVSRALTYFDSHGWTSRTGPSRGPTSRRDLVERGAMLDGWAAWYAARRDDVVLAHALFRDPAAWLSDVVTPAWPSGTWAVTGLVALQRRAPFTTTTNPVDLYLEGPRFDHELPSLLSATELTPTDTGVRVRILRADRYTVALLDETADEELPLVGDIRLYGDLLRRGGVRAEEYATHLREQRIGF